jgi:hypothetical protein
MWSTIIERDVPRTFPGIPQVDGIRRQLSELLIRYSQKDPELGYTQGMSFVAAIIIIGAEMAQRPAEEAFESLMKSLRQLWLPGFPMVVEGSPLFEQLLQERDPELTDHLKDIRFNFHMVIPKVWLSLFAKWLPISSLLEVVPFVGKEGFAGILLVTLLFIIYHRWFLLQCEDFEEALAYLDDIPMRIPPPEKLVDMCTIALKSFKDKVRLRTATSESNLECLGLSEPAMAGS